MRAATRYSHLDDDEAHLIGASLATRSSAGTQPSVLHRPRLSSIQLQPKIANMLDPPSGLEVARVVRDGDGSVVAVSSPFRRPMSRLEAAARVPASPILVSAAIEATVRSARRARGSLPTSQVRAPAQGERRQHSAQAGYEGIVAVMQAAASVGARRRH